MLILLLSLLLAYTAFAQELYCPTPFESARYELDPLVSDLSCFVKVNCGKPLFIKKFNVFSYQYVLRHCRDITNLSADYEDYEPGPYGGNFTEPGEFVPHNFTTAIDFVRVNGNTKPEDFTGDPSQYSVRENQYYRVKTNCYTAEEIKEMESFTSVASFDQHGYRIEYTCHYIVGREINYEYKRFHGSGNPTFYGGTSKRGAESSGGTVTETAKRTYDPQADEEPNFRRMTRIFVGEKPKEEPKEEPKEGAGAKAGVSFGVVLVVCLLILK